MITEGATSVKFDVTLTKRISSCLYVVCNDVFHVKYILLGKICIEPSPPRLKGAACVERQLGVFSVFMPQPDLRLL